MLYPAEPNERAQLDPGLLRTVHDSHGSDWLPALVPIGPSDIDSVSRVARLLRVALDSAALLDYPIRVEHRVAGADQLAEQAGWLQAGTGELLVTRPPAPQELAALPAKVRSLRVTAARARQQGDNRKDVEALLTSLQKAARDIARLTTCPVCAHSTARPDRVLQTGATETTAASANAVHRPGRYAGARAVSSATRF